MYFCSANAQNVANIPPDSITGAFSLLVEYSGAYGNGCKQTFTEHNPGITYIRRMSDISAGHWSTWEPISTATPPQEFDLSLAEGVITVGAVYKNVYSKDQFGIVRVWFSVHFESIPASGTHVFNLPEGFRPDSTCCAAAVLSMAEYYNAIVAIHPSGDALVDHGTIGQSGQINLHGYIEFPAN